MKIKDLDELEKVFNEIGEGFMDVEDLVQDLVEYIYDDGNEEICRSEEIIDILKVKTTYLRGEIDLIDIAK